MKRLLAGFTVAFLAFLPAALAQLEPITLASRVTAHPGTLSFPGSRPQRVDVEIQLSNVQSGEPVAHPGSSLFRL